MIDRISSNLFRGFAGSTGDFDAEERSRRANRRRLMVFLSVFVGLAFIGLVWVFSRPAIYQATARLNFVPVNGQPADDAAAAAAGKQYALRDEVQYLTSRTLLAKVWDDLKDLSVTPKVLHAGDPPATLQTMLTATQVAGTNVVAIDAQGGEPAFLPVFVERLLADYQASLGERYKGGSTTALGDAEDESKKLEAAVADKRRAVDAFRVKYNIVSLEHDENQVLSEVKGTGDALNQANQKVVVAEARLAALKDALAVGKTVTRARDNPTLAQLENTASGIKADLRGMARQFTEQYMNMDPRVREQRARLAEIEEQIVTVRKDSQQGALLEAQEEVASTRGAVSQLRQQLAANQGSVQAFTSHFNEYKALQEQLAHLEQQRQKALDRFSSLDAGERGRKPKVEVVESPSLPQSPISPLYARDAALVLFAALVAGLATMGIVEFFNRGPREASTVVVPQAWTPVGMSHEMPMALPGSPGYQALANGERHATDGSVALPAPLPRELTDTELVALLNAADAEFRTITALLLMGLTPHEVVTLHRADVDREHEAIHVTGADPRSILLPPHLLAWLPTHTSPADAPLFTAAGGRPLADAALATALLYAAHDAGIDGADQVTPQTLRHTYIAFLVRQGMRFSELARVVGPLPADRLASYKRLSPVAMQASANVDLVLPAVRKMAL
jgi:succinoglycan biosynthesis transport protein ExoP